jgi:4-amino-4-deoxy-L-arabinose transferase-like glycosyltransferase
MAHSWHDFFYGAVDPLGTVSVDKLPGALWLQALSVRLFGLHLWAINLPQAVEGILTIPFLFRAARRLCGPRAAICAAGVGAFTPAVVALDRGNVSDSLLILVLVVALDATSAALISGSLTPAVLAGSLVGLATVPTSTARRTTRSTRRSSSTTGSAGQAAPRPRSAASSPRSAPSPSTRGAARNG